MNFVFRGSLCARICDECTELLDNVVIRLYRPAQQENQAAAATAAAKHSLAALSEKDVKAKAGRLLAEATTDENGRFRFEINGDKLDYDGGPFQIDVRLSRVPGQDEEADPVQFTVTTLQPAWRRREDAMVAVWEYCIPQRFWCALRERFDAWVICGRVVAAATGAAVPNVVVHAFDNDWIEDDPLGTATTDSNGRFRIDYTSDTFKQTFLSPIGVDVETPLFTSAAGPDAYFHVETGMGAPLLREDPSVGYGSGREDIGPCFCVTLEIDQPPVDDEPDLEPLPVFNRIGGYHFLTQVDSGPGGDGKTLGSDRAFYSAMRLNGVLPKRINGAPCEYMFEVAEWSGGSLGAYTQIPLAHVAKTNIGDMEIWTGTPGNPVETEPVYVNGNPAAERVASVTTDGWIQVPQESDAFGPGYFHPNGDMIRLVSTHLTGETLDMAGLTPGQSATSTGQPLAQNRYFALRMWVREQGAPATAQVAGTCQRLAICNARYDNVPQGGSWMPHTVNGVVGVHSLDIQELGGGCDGITSSLTVQYTAAAANLGSVSLSMSGPGGPYSFAPISSSPDTFGTATPAFTIGDLPSCAYTVQLSVQVLLTNGDSHPDNLHDQVAFCK